MNRLTAACGTLLLVFGARPSAAASPFTPAQALLINSAVRVLNSYGAVTSTFRTVAHNRAVGGVPNSYHLLDRAIDVVRRPGVTHHQIDVALRKAGFNLVESLDEVDHSHFAFAPLPPKAESTATTTGPPSPPPKLLPRVAADEHGTLAVDLARDAPGTATEVAAR